MTNHVFGAMGTTVESWSSCDRDAQQVVDLFEQVEAVCSRFRPGSELSLINAAPDSELTPSPTMGSLLEAAERVRGLTEGLVDAGMGRAVRLWGYDRTFEDVVDLADEPAPVPHGRWEFADGALTRVGEVELDLGGLAKGWTCDAAVDLSIASVVSAGGDLRSADPTTIVPVGGWGVDVDIVVAVGIGALATSSVSRRSWQVGSRRVSHIVDPRTGRPVETPVISATVIADTAADAEAGAKAVLILGEDGLAWAADQPWIRGALAFWADGSLFATPGVEVAA